MWYACILGVDFSVCGWGGCMGSGMDVMSNVCS